VACGQSPDLSGQLLVNCLTAVVSRLIAAVNLLTTVVNRLTTAVKHVVKCVLTVVVKHVVKRVLTVVVKHVVKRVLTVVVKHVVKRALTVVVGGSPAGRMVDDDFHCVRTGCRDVLDDRPHVLVDLQALKQRRPPAHNHQ